MLEIKLNNGVTVHSLLEYFDKVPEVSRDAVLSCVCGVTCPDKTCDCIKSYLPDEFTPKCKGCGQCKEPCNIEYDDIPFEADMHLDSLYTTCELCANDIDCSSCPHQVIE